MEATRDRNKEIIILETDEVQTDIRFDINSP
jgi:hypothetical protein